MNKEINVPDICVGNKWHKYPDEKPNGEELDEMYLVTDGVRVCFGQFVPLDSEIVEILGSGGGWAYPSEIIEEVTHWQELPEPPGITQKGNSEGKPPFYGKTNGYLVNTFCCGKCGQAVAIAPYQANYCMHCGTKIDWKEFE